jgi:hypothetical protein
VEKEAARVDWIRYRPLHTRTYRHRRAADVANAGGRASPTAGDPRSLERNWHKGAGPPQRWMASEPWAWQRGRRIWPGHRRRWSTIGAGRRTSPGGAQLSCAGVRMSGKEREEDRTRLVDFTNGPLTKLFYCILVLR